MIRKTMTALLAGATMAMTAQSASALDELTVAYFLEWPMPALASKVDGTYEAELGLLRPADSGRRCRRQLFGKRQLRVQP